LLPLAEGRAALTAKIRQLQYGGGTDFKEALDRARRSLVAAGRRVRHVILLTDGDTNRSAPDHDDLIADLARDDVTVTTIRIGDDTVHLDLLNRISRATGGAFHHVEDVEARRLGAGMLVRLTTVGDDPGPFLLRVAEAGEVVLRPTGRRTFSAVVPALEPGAHAAVLVAGGHPEPVEVVAPMRSASGRELRAAAPNLALLEKVARLSGGRVGATAGEILAARPGVARERLPLGAWAVTLALALILADVAARRLLR